MKEFILMSVFVLISIMLFSQNEDKYKVDTTTYIYCDASCNSKVASTVASLSDVNIFLDFGGGIQYSPDKPLIDKENRIINFTSIVDLLNYMSENKWILDKAFSSQVYSGVFARMVTHLIFKKPKY